MKKGAKKNKPVAGQDKHTGHIAHPLKVPAIPIKQANHTLYAFSAKASVLYAALSINRRVQDKDEGYQRVLSTARVEAVTRYIKQKRPIPGAIIVSLDKATFDEKNCQLTIPAGTDVGWVIDGQHRLAGAAQAAREKEKDGIDFDLAVIAFEGLKETDQIEQFVTINKEAKNVPTSLYLDLLHHLPNRSAAEVAKERATDLGTQLRKDEASPFFERIAVVTAPKWGQVSLVNFVRKISLLITKNAILGTYNEREQFGIISNYYHGLRVVFPKEYDSKDSIFFKTVGFGALWNVFPTVFSLALKNFKAFTVKDVAAVFKKIEGADFSSWSQYGTGDQAERNAADDLRASLLVAFKDDNDIGTTIKL
jgi:DGQHR domain-containing protein